MRRVEGACRSGKRKARFGVRKEEGENRRLKNLSEKRGSGEEMVIENRRRGKEKKRREKKSPLFQKKGKGNDDWTHLHAKTEKKTLWKGGKEGKSDPFSLGRNSLRFQTLKKKKHRPKKKRKNQKSPEKDPKS